MNATADHDIVTIPRADALKIYTTPGAIKPYLDQIRSEVDAFQALGTTVDTAKGRQAIKSFAFRITRTKGALKSIGDVLAADVKEIPKKVDATRRLVREQLESWEEEVRRPLTEWENAEKARVDRHKTNIAEIVAAGDRTALEWDRIPPDAMRDRLKEIESKRSAEWQEFQSDAHAAIDDASTRITRAIERREIHDTEAAELARLRKAEEDRLAAERAAQAKRDAEEHERKIAERAAAEERERAEQECQRIERERQAAEERAARAQALADARAREAEAKAAQAVEDERRRQAEEKARLEREAAAREADKKHRAQINNEAKSALIAAGLSDSAAVAAITAIARGNVPHIRMIY